METTEILSVVREVKETHKKLDKETLIETTVHTLEKMGAISKTLTKEVKQAAAHIYLLCC